VENKIRTHGAKEHEAGEGNNPEVPGVDHVASIKLEQEPMLDTSASERDTKRRTDQKGINQLIVPTECDIGNGIDRVGIDDIEVSIRSRIRLALDTRILTVISVGNG